MPTPERMPKRSAIDPKWAAFCPQNALKAAPRLALRPSDRPRPTPTDPKKVDFFAFFQKGSRGIVKGSRGIVKGMRGIAIARDKPRTGEGRVKDDQGKCQGRFRYLLGESKTYAWDSKR